ncbi:DUF5696 domain-containing protein [Paenibacillus camelliae]|uniref:DUF5696 domain-containing protein n=1 Tax=Paenibacillus camelliae TaxID=512410 RepID=UPI00203AE1FF|nr:DUF5696 domain-containing protein [Paenibacillus camelliae]MCM3632720.1 DUF5696 domain-containing protein [Paenibacillus camelliae]
MRLAKKWISFIIVVVLIAGCTNVQPSNQANVEPDVGQISTDTVKLEGMKPVRAAFTSTAVPNMKGMLENDQLQLFVHEETGEIAIVQKKSGEVWYSNPLERDSDPIAAGVNKDMLSAQLKLDFYNSFGQINTINSYTDSAAHKQLTVEESDNGIRVTYQFGTSKRSAEDLPLKLSKARFEELKGEMDKAGQRALLIAYKENKDTETYERNDSALQGLQLDRALQAFDAIGYTEEDLMQDAQEHNSTQAKPEPRIFQAVIEYSLDGESLIATVPVADIQYPEAYPVNMISMLSFFGAADSEEAGSIFVPDGSGALIHFNNGKTKYPAYQQSVYGLDMTMEMTEDANQEQKIRLPVFGMIRNNGAFVAIIEEGASAATINADVSGRLNSYNYVYPSFYVINKGDVTLDANGQRRSLPKFQEQPMSTDYTVRYTFLGKDQASYSDMAQYYQQYLQERSGLPQPSSETQSASTFYLELIGSITKLNHFAGIPYEALEPLTTFEQAKDMITQLEQRNITELAVKYAGWFNGGLDHKVPSKVSVDKGIGGSKGLNSFVAFTKEKNIALFPEASLLMANSSKGFNERVRASRTLREIPAMLYPVDLALNRRDREKSPSYIVSPRYVEGYTESLLKGLTKYDTGGIALRDLADMLNSDFLKNKQIDREQSEQISVQALQMIQQQNLEMLADGGNAYALPYVTHVTNAPMSSSKFKIEDESIPFYQMVIRGFIDYTGSPYNLSTYTDERKYVLKTLEYGSNTYFKWIYEPNYSVKDTDQNDLFAVNYEIWLDQAEAIYSEVNDFLQQVSSKRISKHEKLSEEVYKTTYENGIYVIVNYSDTKVTVDGVTIDAVGYVTGGEQS